MRAIARLRAALRECPPIAAFCSCAAVRARPAVPLHHPGNRGSRGGEVGRPTISPSLFRGPSPLPFVSRSQHVRRVEGRSPRRNFRLRGLHRGRQRACDSAQGSVLGYPRVVGREPLVVAHSKKGDRGLQVIHVGSGCIDLRCHQGVRDEECLASAPGPPSPAPITTTITVTIVITTIIITAVTTTVSISALVAITISFTVVDLAAAEPSGCTPSIPPNDAATRVTLSCNTVAISFVYQSSPPDRFRHLWSVCRHI